MVISSLHRYPIKGCRGVSVDQLTIDRLGAVGDRRFMLVDVRQRFISQREVPLLATLTAREVDGDLEVTGGEMPPLMVQPDPIGPASEVVIWHDRVVSADQGDEAAAWFTKALGLECRLVYFGSAATRLVDSAYSTISGAETAFSDGYPLLVTVQESLEQLNTRLRSPVPMNRFRPNLVISGVPAWSEDHWTRLTIGGLMLDIVKPCARCAVTTTDQVTGARDPNSEPLRTLASFRTVRGGAMFGQNAMPQGVGTLLVGSSVEAR